MERSFTVYVDRTDSFSTCNANNHNDDDGHHDDNTNKYWALLSGRCYFTYILDINVLITFKYYHKIGTISNPTLQREVIQSHTANKW